MLALLTNPATLKQGVGTTFVPAPVLTLLSGQPSSGARLAEPAIDQEARRCRAFLLYEGKVCT